MPTGRDTPWKLLALEEGEAPQGCAVLSFFPVPWLQAQPDRPEQSDPLPEWESQG